MLPRFGKSGCLKLFTRTWGFKPVPLPLWNQETFLFGFFSCVILGFWDFYLPFFLVWFWDSEIFICHFSCVILRVLSAFFLYGFWDFFYLLFFLFFLVWFWGVFLLFFLTIIPVSTIQTPNAICGERTLSTPSRRWKLMTNNMRISRKLVVTSAEKDENYERNHHITKRHPNSITPLRESPTWHKELCLWRN